MGWHDPRVAIGLDSSMDEAMQSNEMTRIVTEAVVRASIAEGLKLLTDVTTAGWAKLRGMVSKWTGAESHRIEGSIQDIIDEPEVPASIDVLARKLKKVTTAIDAELLAEARKLIELFDQDAKTAGTKAAFSQTIGNVSGGSIAIQTGHGSPVNIVQKKTTD